MARDSYVRKENDALRKEIEEMRHAKEIIQSVTQPYMSGILANLERQLAENYKRQSEIHGEIASLLESKQTDEAKATP